MYLKENKKEIEELHKKYGKDIEQLIKGFDSVKKQTKPKLESIKQLSVGSKYPINQSLVKKNNG